MTMNWSFNRGKQASNKSGVKICFYCIAWNEKDVGDAHLLKHGYLNDGMEALFHLHILDQSHVTQVWNIRETGNINSTKHQCRNVKTVVNCLVEIHIYYWHYLAESCVMSSAWLEPKSAISNLFYLKNFHT